MATHSPATDSPSEEAATRLETEGVEACPLCESTATEIWRTDCRDWQQPHAADRFEYEHCARCGVCFLAVRPLESELAKVYFAGYGPYQATPVATARHPRVHFAARAAALPLRGARAAIGLGHRRLTRMLDWVYTPEAEGETLLDYGCGTPTFLDYARQRGFATVGVDFEEDVVRAVRTSGHQGFLVGEDFDRNVPNGHLSCVRMNHVIEHLYHPREGLSAIRTKMRPGGRIHISTPNPASVGSRLFRRHWHALDCPRHVILYRPDVLCELLEGLGFRDIIVVHEVGPKDLTRSWGIVLYDRGRIAHEQIAAMATDRTRLGALLPIASLAALVSAADRYHVFARHG
jgi:2-polyprenyl-3-methyl-5-hydroxy-6-metoxy-1,4-benzoquinol methylase